jgi:pilus assembly protein CpaF
MTTDEGSVIDELCRRLLHDASDLEVAAQRHIRTLAPLLPAGRQHHLVSRALREVRGLGVIEELLDDPLVDEVMVNAGCDVWVDRGGGLHRVTRLSESKIDGLIERILAPLGRRLDRTSPIVDARLADGSRVSAVAPPVAVDGTCLSIRRFRVRPLALDDFASPSVAALVQTLIRRRANMVVAGATSSGKTTLLNALTAYLPPGERIVTLEDIAELRIGSDHVVRLEARPPGDDGPPPVPLGELLRAALRLRPDRLVVGEVRGPEAFDLLQALNTGHDGSLATVHANSPADTLRRLAAMTAQSGQLPWEICLELAHAAIDVVIQVGRGVDGHRRLMEVAEVSPPGESRALRTLAIGDTVVSESSRR